jgi:hypothetical protein
MLILTGEIVATLFSPRGRCRQTGQLPPAFCGTANKAVDKTADKT